MAVFIVYTVDATGMTIVGVFDTHEAAFQSAQTIHANGNPNVWMVCRTMNKSTLPHRVECLTN